MLVNISLRARCVGCVLFFGALSMEPPGNLFWGIPHWGARQAVNGGHKWPKDEKKLSEKMKKAFLKKIPRESRFAFVLLSKLNIQLCCYSNSIKLLLLTVTIRGLLSRMHQSLGFFRPPHLFRTKTTMTLAKR